MTSQPDGDAVYALGRTEEERRRLIEQDLNFGPVTTKFFAEAGIGEGMRVLDLGCGVGDVSFRVVELVGPSGLVVGVDSDPAALETARQRARPAGFSNVEFRQGDVRDLTFDAPFDAVVGRFILLYLREPAATVRHVAGLVRQGGIVAFHEMVINAKPLCYPSLPLAEHYATLIPQTFQAAGADPEMGLKAYSVFLNAGLPAPTIRESTLALAGPASPLYAFMAQTVRSLLPLMVKLGIASEQEVDIETLAERLRDEAVKACGVMLWPPQVGVWTTMPA